MAAVSPAVETESQPSVSSGRWVAQALIVLGLILAVDLLIAARMDVFGLLRDPTGRTLIAEHHVREVKYLFNQRYVPANFDALLIGASGSINWRSQNLTGYRFFNESLEGGNASEQRIMVERALPHGQFKVALVSLTPPMTRSHELREQFEKTRDAEALGSTDSLNAEVDVLLRHLRHEAPQHFADGGRALPEMAVNPDPRDYQVKVITRDDAKAQADYEALLQELQARGIRLLYVVVPEYEPFVEFNRAELDEYVQRQLKQIPAAPVIDFNGPDYKAFRADPRNWIDDMHMSNAGADTLTHMLNERMHAILDH